MLLAFYEPSTRHAICFSIYVNEDCGLAALMQALAAASRKLNCFAALLGSAVVTQSKGFQLSIASCAAGPARTASDVQSLSQEGVISLLRSKRNH